MKFWFNFLSISCLLFLNSCQRQLVGLFKEGHLSNTSEVVEVTFTVENGLIIIPAEIEGNTYRFLLDTGAPNILSKELAEKIEFMKVRKIKTNDSQGNSSVLDYVNLKKININGANFTNTTAGIADLQQVEAIACLNIDGLIGANLMKNAYWQIDYQNNIIRIIPEKKDLIIPPNSFSIPFTSDLTGTPIVHLTIGSTTIKRLKVDTGSVGFISTEYDHLKELKSNNEIINERTSFGANSVGIFGISSNDTSKQVLLKKISIGDLTLDNQIVDFKKGKNSLLGMSFLKNYLVTIDWNNNLISLTPQSNFNNSFAESFGISLYKTGDKMIVSSITEGSSAQTAGIRVGDTVLNVNELDVSNTSLEEYCKIIKMVRIKEADNLRLIIENENGKNEYHITKMPPLTN